MELYLQWLTNGKSYMIYQMVPFSETLDDLELRLFQGHAVRRWVSQKWYNIETVTM